MARASSRFSLNVIRLILLGAFALGFVVPAWAQQASGSVTGSVVDQLGGRVVGAKVSLIREGKPAADTVSDVKGEFAFKAVMSARYQLLVTAQGFDPNTTAPFFVGAGRTTMDVSLQIGLKQDVVVTASATEVPAAQVGASVTTIDRDTLDTLAKPDILEAIRLVPGTSVIQTGGRGGITSLFERGGASNFNKVLIDGVPANDIGGAFDFSEVTTTGVDSVEMLRDANSVLCGSDALAGVVSLTTRQGRTRIPEASFTLDGGTLNTSREDASVGGAIKRFDYFTDFSHFGTNNSTPNNAYHNKTFASRFGVALGNATKLTSTVRRMTSDSGDPNGFALFGIPDNTSQKADATYVSVSAESAISNRWQTTFRFTSSEQGFHTVTPSPTGQPSDPFGSGFPNYLGNVVTLTGANGYSVTGQAILDFSGTYPQLYDQSTTRREGTAQATAHLSRAVDFSAGTHVEHENGFTLFSGSRSATDRTNGGAFSEVRVGLHNFFASAGVGYEHNAIFKSAVTPRVSAAFYLRNPSSTAGFGDTKLTVNAGTGIKAPSISQELSSLYTLVQAIPASSRPASAAGLPPIGPERNRSIDGGIEQALWRGRVRARVSLFDNQFSNLIEFVSNTALPQLGISPAVAAASGFGAYVNSSSYRARGVETSAEARFGTLVHVTGSYTHMHAVVTQSLASSALAPAFNPAFPTIPIGAFGPLVGAAPFRRPANIGNVLITFTKGNGQVALAGYFAGKSDDSTFLSDAFFGNSMLLPNHNLDAAYQKLDLSASYRFQPRMRGFVSIENIANQNYQAAFGFPGLPRTARVGLTVTLGGDRP